MIKLNAGTKEVIVWGLADRLDAITDLTAYNVEQKILTEDEQTIKQDWATVFETSGMNVHTLVDTAGYAEGTYKLYIRVNVPPEIPILGPFEFELS